MAKRGEKGMDGRQLVALYLIRKIYAMLHAIDRCQGIAL